MTERHSIRVWTWQEAKTSNLLSLVNRELHDALDEASSKLKGAVLFEVTFPYGQDIMTAGTPLVFAKDFLKQVDFEGGKGPGLTEENFMGHFKHRADHPLSVVLKGEVEIFQTNEYLYGGSRLVGYRYPIGLFGEGDLFGLYGATDMMFPVGGGHSYFRYSASSGKSCIYPVLPDPDNGVRAYKKITEKLCDEHGVLFRKSSITNLFAKLLPRLYEGSGLHCRILMIPDLWFVNPTTNNRKLRDLIYKTAWNQSNPIRNRVLALNEIIPHVALFAGSDAHLFSELTYSLIEAKAGNVPVWKPASESEDRFKPLYSGLREMLPQYTAYLLHSEVLRAPEDWGMYPIVALPFATDRKTRSSSQIMKMIMGTVVPESEKKLPMVYNGLAYLASSVLTGSKATAFVKKHMPDAFTRGVYWTTVVHIER